LFPVEVSPPANNLPTGDLPDEGGGIKARKDQCSEGLLLTDPQKKSQPGNSREKHGPSLTGEVFTKNSTPNFLGKKLYINTPPPLAFRFPDTFGKFKSKKMWGFDKGYPLHLLQLHYNHPSGLSTNGWGLGCFPMTASAMMQRAVIPSRPSKTCGLLPSPHPHPPHKKKDTPPS